MSTSIGLMNISSSSSRIQNRPATPEPDSYNETRLPETSIEIQRQDGSLTRVSSRLSDICHALTMNLTPERPLGRVPPLTTGVVSLMRCSWINTLLIIVPIAWALHFIKATPKVTFPCLYLAAIPLGNLIGILTEVMTLHTKKSLGIWISNTMGNSVEFISAIIGVRNCELRVVQSSLIGAMLSNLLLILGICLFSGGMQYSEQGFDISMFQMYSVILQITVIAALIPAAFNYLAGPRFPNVIIQAELLQISHIVAVILLFLYFTFVFFQLHSHAQMYCEVERKGERFTTKNNPTGIIVDEQEEILPMLSVRVALLFLVLIIALTVVTVEFLVISIGDLTARVDINKQWIGLILLPLLSGNTMERFKSVTVSMKDKVDLCMKQALGSSIQIAILVIPLVTVIAWMMEKPLMLSSDPFESIVLFFSASALSRILAHGKTNWLTGALLIKLYLLIAIVYWFYPGVDTAELSFECTVVHAFGKVEK